MYKAHLFICNNGPDKEGKCGHKKADDLIAKVKNQLRGDPQIRVNKSGCLGQCEHGIAAVLYPQNEWALNLTCDDDQKLVDLVKAHHKT